MSAASPSSLFVGLMSGTSLDGVDGVLADFSGAAPATLAHAYLPFDPALRQELLALQAPVADEIHREAVAAQQLVRAYSACVARLLRQSARGASEIAAIGAHGQTIRHRPELGYTRQLNAPALLAELSGIDVVADFRSRDIAAGGQGAPLVPAFHRAVFGAAGQTRVVLNIGGIANISVLRGDEAGVTGFDTGPGNVLMDLWIARQRGARYDADGAWAAAGTVQPALLAALCADPYFAIPPPKSTGRDLFHEVWLDTALAKFPLVSPADVQATLAAFTAASIADAIAMHAADACAVYVCGGGACNSHLMQQLRLALAARTQGAALHTTQELGIAPDQVEALAFAWLAQCHLARRPGNLPGVTGARGPRILGALYPA